MLKKHPFFWKQQEMAQFIFRIVPLLFFDKSNPGVEPDDRLKRRILKAAPDICKVSGRSGRMWMTTSDPHLLRFVDAQSTRADGSGRSPRSTRSSWTSCRSAIDSTP